MSLGRPLSKCCGPYWFQSLHLYHSLSLVAVQTVVPESRGSVVTVAINRPKVRNAVDQETARRLAVTRGSNVAFLMGKVRQW